MKMEKKRGRPSLSNPASTSTSTATSTTTSPSLSPLTSTSYVFGLGIESGSSLSPMTLSNKLLKSTPTIPSSSSSSTISSSFSSSTSSSSVASSSSSSSSNSTQSEESSLHHLQTLLKEIENKRQIYNAGTKSTATLLQSVRDGKQEQSSELWKQLQALYKANAANASESFKSLEETCVYVRSLISNKHQKTRTASTLEQNSVEDAAAKKKRRSSVINSIIGDLPQWDLLQKWGDSLPPLVGCTPSSPNYIVPCGEQVAAKISKENLPEEEQWILSTVVNYDEEKGKYEVEDIVDEIDIRAGNKQEKYILSPKSVIPLPRWQPHWQLTSAFYPKGTSVFALYPQTTCFYPGTVYQTPTESRKEYLINFLDDEDVDGTTPDREIPVKFVIAPSKPPK